MRNSAWLRRGLGLGFVAAAAVASGCDRSDRDVAKMPLGQARAPYDAAMRPTITGEAKTALDSANSLFRARAYQDALVQYQRSAQLAPTELAPLLGILMVAEATSNTRLADSTLQRMRRLDPAAADSAAARSHADILKTHPTQ